MKKALIIANMMFASATVFGMDQQSVRIGEISDISQSANMTQVSSVKDKCRELFEQAQSGLAENKWLSEDAKLLYSRLKFEDIWEEIELLFFSDESKRNDRNASNAQNIFSRLEQIFGKKSPEAKNIQTLLNGPEVSFRQIVKGSKFGDSLRRKAIESAGKRGAKLFYKDVLGVSGLEKDLYKLEQVLGIPGLEKDLREIEQISGTSEPGSELAKYLYRRAVYEIDSAKYVPGINRYDSLSSQNAALSGIECGYYDYDDLLFILIHETGHSLDWIYRIRKTFGKPITKMFEKLHLLENRRFFGFLSTWYMRSHYQQSENISTFFESLTRSPRFKGNLHPKDSSAHKFRIFEGYIDFITKSVVYELINSYDKAQLSELLSKNDKHAIIQKLQENNLLGRYIKAVLEKPRMFVEKTAFNLSMSQRQLWDKCLLLLTKRDNKKLYEYLLDVERGERKILGRHTHYSYPKGIQTPIEIQLFEFSAKPSEVEVSPKRSDKTIMKNSSKVKVFLPKLNGIDWAEIWFISEYVSSESERVIQYMIDKLKTFIKLNKINILNLILNPKSNLDNHTEGKYNAFRLIKEKGYFDILERGESLPIEEAMEELTKPAEPLNLTEKSIEEFFEFLRTGKLVS